MTCGACIQKKPFFDEALAPYHYEEPLKTLLHEFKYQKGLYLTSFFSQLIIQHLTPALLQTECLIPVPLHPKRLCHRGFNQAAELTKAISKAINIPYHLRACEKMIHTPPQAALTGEQRHSNLLNTFRVNHIPFKRVTLIDDLLTTGSTANELAKTLKNKGVEHVAIWCCARVVAFNGQNLKGHSTINDTQYGES